MTALHYRLFGLAIASELELAELAPIPAGNAPDLVIRCADLDDALPRQPGFHPLGDASLLVIDGVGRFLARGGRELWIEAAPAVPARNLRLFLLGSGMGMLLHQRGLLPLHANAVVVDGRAFAFCGPSGTGKSTLAASFQEHGCRLLSDDVCAIGLDTDGRPVTWSGLPRLRLWRDAIERSGRRASDYPRSFEEEGDEWDKYDVPATLAGGPAGPVPLGGIFLLDRAERGRVAPLPPAEALTALFSNIYRGEYLAGPAHERAWRTCLQIAHRLPVARWFRPWDVAQIDQATAALVRDLSQKSER